MARRYPEDYAVFVVDDGINETHVVAERMKDVLTARNLDEATDLDFADEVTIRRLEEGDYVDITFADKIDHYEVPRNAVTDEEVGTVTAKAKYWVEHYYEQAPYAFCSEAWRP